MDDTTKEEENDIKNRRVRYEGGLALQYLNALETNVFSKNSNLLAEMILEHGICLFFWMLYLIVTERLMDR